jgi:hypothetical protein
MTQAKLIGGKNDIRELKSRLVEAGCFRSARFAILIASVLLGGCGISNTEVTTAPAPGQTVLDETVPDEAEVVPSELTKPALAEPKSQDGESNVGKNILKGVAVVGIATVVVACVATLGLFCVM